MSKNMRRLAIGTIFAALAGYAAGILTAPKSGKETRRDIQRAGSKAKTNAEHALKKLHSELDELLKQSSQKSAELKHTAKEEIKLAVAKARLAKGKARELLSALHEGDADDHDLQKALKEAKQAIKHLKL